MIGGNRLLEALSTRTPAGTGCPSRRPWRAGYGTEPVPAPAYRYGFGCPPWRKIEEENLLVEDFCDL